VNNHPGELYQPVLSTFVSLHPAAPNVPIHVPQDFLPIGFVAENPMFIAVSPSLGVSTLPELIARAKKAPGEISYAATGVGRLTHLTGELLQREAGIKLCNHRQDRRRPAEGYARPGTAKRSSHRSAVTRIRMSPAETTAFVHR
jgi:tripartite-type tricarboxylate transporter receptor subunit TctC